VQLVLSEDQELLAKTAADFAAQHCPVSRTRALRDSGDPDGFSRALWKQMAELGWVGIPFPEACGGADLGLADLAVVLEALGRGLAPEPFLSTVLLGGQALLLGGSEAQRLEWLPGVVSGERLLALAFQERGSRYDVRHVATRAEPTAEGWRLSGEKVQVLDGNSADVFLVSARVSGDVADRAGIGLFLVPPRTGGLQVVRQQRLDSRNAALLRLDAVAVSRDAAIGDATAAGDLLERVVDRATLGLCAEMLGAMGEAFQRTLRYLKDRRQFGVPIGSFQALKHRAAELFIQIELCRSCVMAAARAVDGGLEEAPALVSLCKARCSDAAVQVSHEAVQMHGGIGMTDEHDIGLYLKRARVAELSFGDAGWHRDRWARLGGY
jgi:alkylation response protein AidB-like acyl-CoA dehydrogenase